MFTIVQELTYVGTHEPKQIVKRLSCVPHKWFCSVNGDKGVLYWPPTGTKPALVEKMTHDKDCEPNKETWLRLDATCKCENVSDHKPAKHMIQQLRYETDTSTAELSDVEENINVGRALRPKKVISPRNTLDVEKMVEQSEKRRVEQSTVQQHPPTDKQLSLNSGHRMIIVQPNSQAMSTVHTASGQQQMSNIQNTVQQQAEQFEHQTVKNMFIVQPNSSMHTTVSGKPNMYTIKNQGSIQQTQHQVLRSVQIIAPQQGSTQNQQVANAAQFVHGIDQQNSSEVMYEETLANIDFDGDEFVNGMIEDERHDEFDDANEVGTYYEQVDPTCMTDANFAKLVSNQANIAEDLVKVKKDVAAILNGIASMKESLEKFLKEARPQSLTLQTSSAPSTDLITNIEPLLKTVDEVNEFERKLANNDFFKEMFAKLSTLFGTNNDHVNSGYTVCSSVLQCIFSVELLMSYTKTGTSRTKEQKNSFSTLIGIKRLMFSIVQAADNKFTVQRMDDVITGHLRNSKAKAAAGASKRKSAPKARPKNFVYNKKRKHHPNEEERNEDYVDDTAGNRGNDSDNDHNSGSEHNSGDPHTQ